MQSFFIGGFECSAHRRRDGRRLDLIAATGHDTGAARDFALLREHGIAAARDGVRWHLVESEPHRYDCSSLTPILHAARDANVEVIWDLCHYGYPDHIDIWSPDTPARFAAFAREAARVIAEQTRGAPQFCVVNEISYWAWAGGSTGQINPLASGRGGELKQQLVRMAIAATHAVRLAVPNARFTCSEPLIRVAPGHDAADAAARRYHDSQYEAADMLLGRMHPELGGGDDMLDTIGVNFYPENQWFLDGPTIPFGHSNYRPFSDMLGEIWARYRKPLLLTETGAEGSARAAWLHYVCDEVRSAMAAGGRVEGVCLYPVADYPGWENERHCPVGLFSQPNANGRRTVAASLADELRRQQALFC